MHRRLTTSVPAGEAHQVRVRHAGLRREAVNEAVVFPQIGWCSARLTPPGLSSLPRQHSMLLVGWPHVLRRGKSELAQLREALARPYRQKRGWRMPNAARFQTCSTSRRPHGICRSSATAPASTVAMGHSAAEGMGTAAPTGAPASKRHRVEGEKERRRLCDARAPRRSAPGRCGRSGSEFISVIAFIACIAVPP